MVTSPNNHKDDWFKIIKEIKNFSWSNDKILLRSLTNATTMLTPPHPLSTRYRNKETLLCSVWNAENSKIFIEIFNDLSFNREQDKTISLMRLDHVWQPFLWPNKVRTDILHS